MNDPAGARGYQSYPLTGSPLGQLRDDAARMLASGLLPRCPHEDQPVFWYLPATMLTCVACTDEAMRDASGGTDPACHICGAPSSAVAAWVSDGVPCIAGLCEQCHTDGLVPLAPN